MARPGQFDLLALLPVPCTLLSLSALSYIVGDFGCLFGILMKCHAVQVQLVLYGARSLKAAPDVLRPTKIDFLLFLPFLCYFYFSSASSSSYSSFRLPSAVCTVSEIDI